MKKVKVHIIKEVEVEINDKFEVLDCDFEEWHKRYQENKITEELIEECIAEIEANTGLTFFSKDTTTEYINFIEGKYTMLES